MRGSVSQKRFLSNPQSLSDIQWKKLQFGGIEREENKMGV